MRAVIVATGDGPGIAPLSERYPVPMLPLVDRPFIQHVVEYLVLQGVNRFDWVLSHLPERIEEFLGPGKRWGSTFTFHLARDPSRPYGVLKTLNFQGEEDDPVLFGHADRLPALEVAALQARFPRQAPLLLGRRQAGDPPSAASWGWSAWAVVLPEHLMTVPADVDENGLGAHLLSLDGEGSCWLEVQPTLSVQTLEDLLASQWTVLGKAFSGLHVQGSEADPGIWLSRNVTLHPTAKFHAPVYVGENTEIGAAVDLGPQVVVGPGCVLDNRCTAKNAIIFPGTYVGKSLGLGDVIVDKNYLLNIRIGGAVTVTDNFLLGSIADRLFLPWLGGLLSRALGLALLLLASPVLLLAALTLLVMRRGPVLHRQAAVSLPTPPAEATWVTFNLWSFGSPGKRGATSSHHQASFRNLILHFLPALVNVARGDLRLVGVPARSPEEIKALPRDWQALYLRTKCGVITEAAVHCGNNPSQDDLYAAEAVYAVTRGWRHDLRLVADYFCQVLFGFFLPRKS